MKREKHSTNNDDTQVDMTPMLDIVFIMLIFFIVTTTFSNEKGLTGNRPMENAPDLVYPSNALSISIDADGQIKMLGRTVDIRRVIAGTQLYLVENKLGRAAIQAHENTEHGLVVEVMDLIKQAGINEVSLLVKKE